MSETGESETKFGRRKFLGGVVAGALGMFGIQKASESPELKKAAQDILKGGADLVNRSNSPMNTLGNETREKAESTHRRLQGEEDRTPKQK